MPSGLQVWDAAGALIIDTSTPIAKFLGELSIGSAYTGAAQSGSIIVPQFTAYVNEPFVARIDGAFSDYERDAVLWADGNLLRWEFPEADPFWSSYSNSYLNRPNQTVIYGIL